MLGNELNLRAVICLLVGISLAFETASGKQIEKESAQQVKYVEGKETQLTFDGHLKHDPVFIDSGKSLVYTSLEKFNQLCLMRLDLSNQAKATTADKTSKAEGKGKSKPERFHGAASTSELMVTFSKNENVYAYLRNNGNLHFEIVLKDDTTGKSVSYNPGGGFAGVRIISYAPSGSNVIFAFPNQAGQQQLQSLDRDGKTVRLLTNSEGVNRSPKYSVDGKRIVCATSRDGDFDIFTMNSDGSRPVNVTKALGDRAQGMDTHPCFSPDGKQIAFTGLREGNYDIFVMNQDGTNLRRLTRNSEVDDFPCWSPDGRSIVWVAERDGKRDLYSKKIR